MAIDDDEEDEDEEEEFEDEKEEEASDDDELEEGAEELEKDELKEDELEEDPLPGTTVNSATFVFAPTVITESVTLPLSVTVWLCGWVAICGGPGGMTHNVVASETLLMPPLVTTTRNCAFASARTVGKE